MSDKSNQPKPTEAKAILNFAGEVSLSSGQQYEIFRSLGDLLFIKDAKFRIVDANQAFIDLYPPDKRHKVIGYTTFEDYPEEQMLDFVAEDQKALDEGLSEVQETIDFPDGQRRTLLTRKVGITGPDGERYVFGSARDITEVLKTEEALKNANAELEEFAYRVSHDFRSPLISSTKLLTLAVDALKNGSTEEASRFVETSLESISSLNALAQNILDLTRLQRATVINEPIDFQTLIDQVWRRHHEDKPVALETHFDLSYQPFADPQGIGMLLDNLISNAIKYRDTGNPNALIYVGVRSDQKNINITVRDNGIGIPKDKRDRLFSMFQRFHPRVETGTGLGLYMVKQWVTRLEGTLVANHLDQGTEFVIEIPQSSAD